MYISCGRQDKALEMMNKIEDDNQRVASRSASYHTPMKEQEEQREKQQHVVNSTNNAALNHESRNLLDVPLEGITIATRDNNDHVNVSDIDNNGNVADIGLHDSHKKIINLVLLSLPLWPLNCSSTV